MSNPKEKTEGVPQLIEADITELEIEPDTVPHQILANELAIFEQGWAAGRHQTISDFLDEFRLGLIEGGNDAGLAYHLAEELGRKVGIKHRY